ncbi:MAG TPA: OmpA family protein, partial [Labilithrix sp.]|nr:OmpA family protein [Labilithrix sp.]
LQERARRVISKLATELKSRPVEIRVEGHTDDRPIRTVRFRSNWDLSTARATAVVARLAAEGIEPPRLSAAGYGEFHPLASNATDDGRKQNRRVDLVISMPVVAKETPVETIDGTIDGGATTENGEPAKARRDKAEAAKADDDKADHDSDADKSKHESDDDDSDGDDDKADHDKDGQEKSGHDKHGHDNTRHDNGGSIKPTHRKEHP